MRRFLFRLALLAVLAAVHLVGLELFDRAQRGVVTRRVLEFALPLDGDIAKRYEKPETIRVAKVILAGPFSGWNRDDNHYRMEAAGPGRWRFEMTFDPGHNQYKFVLHLAAPLREKVTGNDVSLVWAHDPRAGLNIPDGFDGKNSVVLVPDYRAPAEVFRFATLGLVLAMALLLLLDPAVRWLLRRRLPFRWKLVVAVVAFGVLGNLAFIAYNLHETGTWRAIAALDAVAYHHNYLLANGIRPGMLTNAATAARARRLLHAMATNSTTRTEPSKIPNTATTLLRFEILDRDLVPRAWCTGMEWESFNNAAYRGYADVDRYYLEVSRRVRVTLSEEQGEEIRARSAGERDLFDACYEKNPAGNEWWLKRDLRQAPLERLAAYYGNRGESGAGWARILVEQLARPGLAGGKYVWRAGTLLVPIVHQHRHYGYYLAEFFDDVDRFEARRILEFNLYLLAIAAAVLFLLLRSVGGLVTSHLVALTEWTKAVAGGDFSMEKTIRTGDEIEVLAGNFDTMRLALAADVERLETLNRLKDDFMANTSHELRTPLVGIIGLADTLLDGAEGALSPGQRRHLEMVAASGRRLSALVNDILDFSKLRHRNIELRLGAVDVHAVADVVLAVSKSIVGGKPLTLTNAVPRDLPPAHADEDRLSQVLFNLVGNAVKFTNEGTVAIDARLDGAFVAVSVSDTGIGIPPDKLETVFIAFEQADGSVAREFGGTGLGLSITKSLVELHGGALSVASRVGEGSTFTFTLPLAPPDVVPARDAATSTRSGLTAMPLALGTVDDRSLSGVEGGMPVDSTPRQGPGSEGADRFRILVVDDEPINLQVLTSQLRLERYDVEQAVGGEEALVLLEDEARFDLVLLDVMMPRVSGYDVCRALRAKSGPMDLPVLMLTAKNRVDDIVAGFESGANDYLTKPFDKRELISRVRTLTALHRAVLEHNQFQLLKQELDVARRIQLSILPKRLPDVPGLAIAARYLPMAEVGGDFYDFLPAGDGKLGVLVADVSGHGVPAALVSAMIKVAYGQQGGFVGMPDRVLTGLNTDLLGKLDKSYLTAGCLFVDLGARRLLYASAGHPPLLVVKRPAGRVVPHKPAGRIVGWFDDPKPALAEAAIEAGDRIVLYTDGIVEAFSPADEEWGDERFEEFLLATAALAPDACADALVAVLRAWTGKAQDSFDDDVTLVIVDVA